MTEELRLAVFRTGRSGSSPWWTTLVARKGGEWRSVCAGGDSCRECPAGRRCRDFQFASLEEAELRLAAEGQRAWAVGGWSVNADGEMVVEGGMRRIA